MAEKKEDKENTVLKQVSKHVVSVAVGAIAAMVPFYYTTQNRLENLEKSELEAKTNLDKVSKLEIEPEKIYICLLYTSPSPRDS